MAERQLYAIGSYPADTPEAAMRAMLERAGPYLAQLPDGETGGRSNWAIGIIQTFRSHPDLEIRRDGEWSDYDDPLVFRVRRGHRLEGTSFDLGHVASYQAANEPFERLRTEFGRPDLAFQAGIPGDLDMAVFTLGRTGALLHRRPFTDATVQEISEIRRLGGDEVVIQLEAPAEQAFVVTAPAALRPAVAAWAGRGLAELARRSPVGTRFGVHLCLGDLGHQARVWPADSQPFVTAANAVARRWPAGRPLEYVHVPLAAGPEPPTTDPAFYAPLGGLRLSPRTRLVAGLLHETLTVEEQRAVLGIVEDAVGAPVDVAAACGLGRRDRAAAEQTLELGVELCRT